MSATEVHSPTSNAEAGKVEMRLEIQVIPVSDVDRAKEFYERLGWRLDDDGPAGRSTHRPVHAAGVPGLDHVRHRTHYGRAWLGRGRADRLRHRGGP